MGKMSARTNLTGRKGRFTFVREDRRERTNRGKVVFERVVVVQCDCGKQAVMQLCQWDGSGKKVRPEMCRRCALAQAKKVMKRSRDFAEQEKKAERKFVGIIRDAEHARELIAKGLWP